MNMIKIRFNFVKLKLILFVKSNSSLIVLNNMQVYNLNIRLILLDNLNRPLYQLPRDPISSKFIYNPDRHYISSFLRMAREHWFSRNFIYHRFVCFISDHDCSNNNPIIKCPKTEPAPSLNDFQIKFFFILDRKPFFVKKFDLIHVVFCQRFKDKKGRVKPNLGYA